MVRELNVTALGDYRIHHHFPFVVVEYSVCPARSTVSHINRLFLPLDNLVSWEAWTLPLHENWSQDFVGSIWQLGFVALQVLTALLEVFFLADLLQIVEFPALEGEVSKATQIQIASNEHQIVLELGFTTARFHNLYHLVCSRFDVLLFLAAWEVGIAQHNDIVMNLVTVHYSPLVRNFSHESEFDFFSPDVVDVVRLSPMNENENSETEEVFLVFEDIVWILFYKVVVEELSPNPVIFHILAE